jgi:hypothetical protein
MSLLIKGGEIITGDEHFIGDILCEHDRITHIDRNIDAPAGAEVINASGKYVFPGFIDPHVHIYLPFMGTFSKDTYETASKAALAVLLGFVSRDGSVRRVPRYGGVRLRAPTFGFGLRGFIPRNRSVRREVIPRDGGIRRRSWFCHRPSVPERPTNYNRYARGEKQAPRAIADGMARSATASRLEQLAG